MKEIEKKFLVSKVELKTQPLLIYQGYYIDSDNQRKRIRLLPQKQEAITAYKEDIGIINGFMERIEIENSIEYSKGLFQLKSCEKFLVKERYFIPFDNRTFEVDVFKNLPDNLITAELEIEIKDIQMNINYPAWLGKDISQDKSYNNVSLVNNSIDHKKWLEILKYF